MMKLAKRPKLQKVPKLPEVDKHQNGRKLERPNF